MATLAQLQAEPWWGQEYAPPSLWDLRFKLLTRWGVSGNAIGIKGDENHLYGYHRSRDWVRNSAYCTNRTYSVSRTWGDKSGGDGRWLAAMDISLSTAPLLQVCQRLDQAVRAGRLEKVTEWYGNVNGDRIVDGYDNIANRVASSDDSHLWHVHISFDRGRVAEDHSDLFNILTGEDDMLSSEEHTWLRRIHQRTYALNQLLESFDLGGGEGAEKQPGAVAIKALLERPAVELTDAQLEALADKVAARLGHGNISLTGTLTPPGV